MAVADHLVFHYCESCLSDTLNSTVLTYVYMHPWPPAQHVYSLLGLSDTQVTTVRAVMQALLSEALTFRDDQSVCVTPET